MTADPPSRSDGPDPGLDVDAAWAEIVANWGSPSADAPQSGESPPPEPPAAAPLSHPAPPAPPVPVPEPTWVDPLNTRATSWEDEGHFVPPVPPPLPAVEPRRRAAWVALLGSPAVGLLLVLLQVGIPRWISSFLACAFVGGFCYLVATMGQSSGEDWSGDDGAVL